MSNGVRHSHQPRSIRLQGYDYALPAAYFVTICAADRACWFGTAVEDEVVLTSLGQIVANCWEAIPAHFADVELDAFVVMPNHVHGVVVITELPRATHASPLRRLADRARPRGPAQRSIGAIIGSFKAAATKQARILERASSLSLWQRGFFEHVIRDGQSLDKIRRYIADKPERWAFDRENPAAKSPDPEMAWIG